MSGNGERHPADRVTRGRPIPSPRVTIPQALAEAQEVAGITCATCTGIALEDSRYCLSCGIYWADVDRGMFDA